MDGQFLSKFQSGYDPNLKMFPYDPEKAKQLLKDAGYPNGFEAEITYTTGRYPLDKQAGEAVAGYLRAVGLKISEKAVDFPEFARQFEAVPRQTTAFYQLGFLFGEDGYAVETVVAKSDINTLIPALKDHGATGILELPISKIVQ